MRPLCSQAIHRLWGKVPDNGLDKEHHHKAKYVLDFYIVIYVRSDTLSQGLD